VFADRLVGMAHERGIAVLVWTVDEPAWMNRLLDAGADGVITDRPDLLREVMLSRGVWVSPPVTPARGTARASSGPAGPAGRGCAGG
jgi:glycerophosphoryl diester phosphodiesterase